MRDLGYEAQQAAQKHLDLCDAAVWGDSEDGEDAGDPESWPASPASAPYDGCETCRIRETLHAAWSVLLSARIEELLEAQAELTKAGPERPL